MKKESSVIDVLVVLAIIILLCTAILLPLSNIHYKNSEISKEEYAKLANYNKKYPTVSVLVKLSLQNDNKVSNEEFRNIMDYVNGRDKEEELKKMGL